MPQTAKSIYLCARARGRGMGGTGGRGNRVLRRGQGNLETRHGRPLHRYLGIGQGMHREEAVDIRIRPGQITSTSGSIHRHEVRCDTTDFGAVAEALHTGIRWHIRRNML